MDSFNTIYRGGAGEITEKKSRFIAQTWPVRSPEEALAILEETRKKYWDARHNCWAYIIGRNPATERMSDDGEPAGTAGKPILEVLRGRELTDILVIVTRYFGGTLLGTGGLVRAYTAAALAGIGESEVITKIRGVQLGIKAEYTDLGKIQYLLGKREIPILDTVYTDKAEIQALVPATEEAAVRKDITEGTNGQALMEKERDCWFAQTAEGLVTFEEV